MVTLTVEAREGKNSIEMLRQAGKIPAVFYGKGKTSTPVTVKKVEFLKVFKEAGESTVISLKTPEGDEDSLVQEIQTDPVTNEIIHIDFKILEKGKAVKVDVPLEFIGEAPAAKSGLGVLTKNLHEIEIEALPKDLPSSIDVDLSSLTAVDAQILVSDLTLPKGVTAITKGEDVIVVITPVREEKEEASAPIDFSQIEVEKKGKKEEEGAEAAPADEKK